MIVYVYFDIAHTVTYDIQSTERSDH